MSSSESWNTSVGEEVEEVTTDAEEESTSPASQTDDTIQQSTEQTDAPSSLLGSEDSNLSGSQEVDEEYTDVGDESVAPETQTESETIHPSIEQPETQCTNMSGSEDSNPTLSPDMDEETTNMEEESTSATAQTECETSQQSIDENKTINEIEHDAQDLDRDNANLRTLIEEMNLLNARQQEEFNLQEGELEEIRAALHDEQTKNEANESYIKMAERSNKHLQEENTKQADLLGTYSNERTRLAHELGSRERAMGELQISFQETEQLTERYEQVLENFREERKEWKKSLKAKTVTEQSKELRERLTSAIKMGEKSDGMVRAFRSRASLHRVDFEIIRGRITGGRFMSGTISAASDETIDDASGNPLEMRIRSAKSPDDMMKSDSSISSEFGRMAIDSESEYASETGTELETATESTAQTIESEQMDARVAYEHQRQQVQRAYSQRKQAYPKRGHLRHDHIQQQNQWNEQPRNMFQQLIDNKRAKIRADGRASAILPGIQQVAQGAQPKQVYSKEMEWKRTKTSYLPTSPANLHQIGASVLARKRRRSADDVIMADVDEECLSVKEVKVCKWCGIGDRDAMRPGVGNSNARRDITAECLIHKGRTEPPVIQTEHGTTGGQSYRPRQQVSARTQVKEPPAASTSARTKEIETSLTGTHTGYLTDPSKRIKAKPVSRLSRTPRTNPVHVRAPANRSPSPSNGKQRQQNGIRKVHIPGKRRTDRSKSLDKRLANVNNMPNSLAAYRSQPQDEPENQLRTALQQTLQIVRPEWVAAAACLLIGLGLVMYLYFWHCNRQEGELWMKANRVPRNVLRELRGRAAHEFGWRDKVNYELVQWLDIDRVARG